VKFQDVVPSIQLEEADGCDAVGSCHENGKMEQVVSLHRRQRHILAFVFWVGISPHSVAALSNQYDASCSAD
jgi:hypothetical protein